MLAIIDSCSSYLRHKHLGMVGWLHGKKEGRNSELVDTPRLRPAQAGIG